MTPYERSQVKLGRQVLQSIPKNQQAFYGMQFQVIGSRPVGAFVGLACKCCNNWLDCGHDKGCPAKPISQAAIKKYNSLLKKHGVIQ
jgi:hypothetical protein